MKRVTKADRRTLTLDELLGKYGPAAVHRAIDADTAPKKRGGRKPLQGNEISMWLAASLNMATTGEGPRWACKAISRRLCETEDGIIVDRLGKVMREEKVRWDTIERIFRRVEKRRNEDAQLRAATDRMLETQLDKIRELDPAAVFVLPYRVASRQGPDSMAIILLGKRK
jgi:hypothetical protein